MQEEEWKQDQSLPWGQYDQTKGTKIQHRNRHFPRLEEFQAFGFSLFWTALMKPWLKYTILYSNCGTITIKISVLIYNNTETATFNRRRRIYWQLNSWFWERPTWGPATTDITSSCWTWLLTDVKSLNLVYWIVTQIVWIDDRSHTFSYIWTCKPKERAPVQILSFLLKPKQK